MEYINNEETKEKEIQNIDEFNILVLGNGFDIACGYNTSYEDFLDFLKSFNEIANMKFEDDRKLIEIIKNNSFIKWFLSVGNLDGKWLNVEEEIGKIGSAINSHINRKIIQPSLDPNHLSIEGLMGIEKELLICFNILDKNGIINNKYISFSDMKINIKAVEEMLDYEMKSVKEAIRIFLNKATLSNRNNKKCDVITKLLDSKIIDYVYSLNYTNTEEKYGLKEKTHHLHGTLNQNNLVFGSSNTPFYCLNKGYQITNSNIKINKAEDIVEIDPFYSGFEGKEIKKKAHVFVFGYSLCVEDYYFIKDLYNYAKEFTVYCYNENAKREIIENLYSIFGQQQIDEDKQKGKLKLVTTE